MLIILFKMFYYFYHIVLFSTKLGNRSVWKFVIVLQSFCCFHMLLNAKDGRIMSRIVKVILIYHCKESG
jgi:hypothetical protein